MAAVGSADVASYDAAGAGDSVMSACRTQPVWPPPSHADADVSVSPAGGARSSANVGHPGEFPAADVQIAQSLSHVPHASSAGRQDARPITSLWTTSLAG